jgi:diguanylate cyclase (GGDEF)-like protein
MIHSEPLPETKRTGGLRRQWTRAFAVLLLLLLTAGAMTFTFAHIVVARFDSAARQLGQEGIYSANLRHLVAVHIDETHHLMDAIKAPAYLTNQRAIVTEFQRGLDTFTAPTQQTTLLAARTQWEASLRAVGYWKVAPVATHQSPPAAHFRLSGASVAPVASLEQLDAVTRVLMNHQLAKAERLKDIMVLALAGMIAIAIVSVILYARRMSRSVLRPVDVLREGVGRLRQGDLEHRVTLTTHKGASELTDLAGAFNAMAEALNVSHDSLTFQAKHDALTGLVNRSGFADHLEENFSEHRRTGLSVLFIDVDDFKLVNDSLGHAAGDELLIQLADRLRKSTRLGDVVARIGGDEFAVAVIDNELGVTASALARRVLAAVLEPFTLAGNTQTVSVSVGICSCTPDLGSVEELLCQADFAMYTAKSSGKGRYEVYDARLRAATLHRSTRRGELVNRQASIPVQRESTQDGVASVSPIRRATATAPTPEPPAATTSPAARSPERTAPSM